MANFSHQLLVALPTSLAQPSSGVRPTLNPPIPRDSFWVYVAVAVLASVMVSPLSNFETNDDVVMMLIASGVIGDPAGDHHLMFMSSIVGRMLNAAYRINPTVEWYGWLLLSLGALSCASFGWCIDKLIRRTSATRTCLISVAITAAMATVVALNIQFTRTALYLGSASGALLAVALICGSPSSKRPLQSLLLSVSSAALGILLRDNAAMLGFGLTLPLLFVAVRDERSRTKNIRVIAAVAFTVASILVCHRMFERWTYGSAEWKKALITNRLIVPIADFHLHRKLCDLRECAIKGAVFSENDLALLDLFVYNDGSVYSEEHFRTFNSALFTNGTGAIARLRIRLGPLLRPLERFPVASSDPVASQETAVHAPGARNGPRVNKEQAASTVVDRQLRALLTPGFVMLCAITGLLIFLSGRQSRLEVAGTFCFTVSVLFMLSLFTKSLPPRVVDPTWMCAALATLLIGIRGGVLQQSSRRKLFLTGVSATLLLVLAVSLPTTLRISRISKAIAEDFRNALADSRRPVVAFAGGFPLEGLWRPLGGNATLKERDWLVIGWTSLTPIQVASDRRLGLRRALVEIPCNPSLAVLATDTLSILLNRFAEEHGSRQCRLSRYRSTNSFSVWSGNADKVAKNDSSPRPAPPASIRRSAR